MQKPLSKRLNFDRAAKCFLQPARVILGNVLRKLVLAGKAALPLRQRHRRMCIAHDAHLSIILALNNIILAVWPGFVPQWHETLIVETEALTVVRLQPMPNLGQTQINVCRTIFNQVREARADLLLVLARHGRLECIGIYDVQQQLALAVGEVNRETEEKAFEFPGIDESTALLLIRKLLPLAHDLQ